MMGGLKSPTMNRQDRQTRNAIKRNPSPNEIRPPTLGIGPKPQNDRIAKSKATIVHNVLKNIASPPPISAALILGDDSAMVASRVGGAYDTTTRSASCYNQTETLPKSSTSTARHRGEAALMEEQAKLRLVIEVAREVWG